MNVMNCLWWVVVTVAIQIQLSGAELKLPGNEISGILYTNYRIRSEPWSIHVVKVDRKNPSFELRSMHAEAKALGLSTLTEQIDLVPASAGKPVAAINGDFYQRDTMFAGDPRGLQISDGDILSNPTGNATFWVDAVGEPHVGNISSQFQILLPDGNAIPFEVNGSLRSDRAVLFTEAVGEKLPGYETPRTVVLEPDSATALSPLHVGRSYAARVKHDGNGDDSKIPHGGAILAIGSRLGRSIPRMEAGAKVKLLTLCTPNLKGIKTAIGGGPVLMQDGKRVRMPRGNYAAYESSSMSERHPRTAIGWNDQYYFFVEVDGRQRGSAGMTLDELADFMGKVGCENLMNLDGGGSATLWFMGRVRNRPCDGREREIANSLVMLWKGPAETAKTAETGNSR